MLDRFLVKYWTKRPSRLGVGHGAWGWHSQLIKSLLFENLGIGRPWPKNVLKLHSRRRRRSRSWRKRSIGVVVYAGSSCIWVNTVFLNIFMCTCISCERKLLILNVHWHWHMWPVIVCFYYIIFQLQYVCSYPCYCKGRDKYSWRLVLCQNWQWLIVWRNVCLEGVKILLTVSHFFNLPLLPLFVTCWTDCNLVQL
jgi:hypothetical protein